ncbi:MAG: VWA domain-containing protein [Candidatus Diapherotrites archaeon]|nr:VWA domain-containing protein [Candidatus Diapherotrites archaeon]
MYKKIILLIALALLLPTVLGLSVEGNCSDEVVQCEVAINNLEVCNLNPDFSETFYASTAGLGGNWVQVLPGQMTLAPGECETLNLFMVAPCYEEPGTYPYNIVIHDGETVTLDCEFTVMQGHKVSVEIEPESQTAHECEEKTYEVTLTNNSNTPNQNTEIVSLELFGSASEWAELSETELEVTKGHPEQIELKVKAPCEQPKGDYIIGVRAELFNQDFYSEDTAEYILVGGQDLRISADIEGNEFEACEEQDQIYFISLENNGLQNDTYELNLIGPEFAELKEERVSVDAGTKKDVQLTLKKTNNAPKEFDLTLQAKSVKFNYETSKNFKVKLNDCYNLDVELISGKTVICSEEENEYKFKVKNLTDRKINVDLTVNGIEGSLSDKAIILEGFASEDIVFTPSVENYVTEGTAKEKPVELELVIDTSGSMVEKIGDERKIDSAKRAANEFIASITNVKMALRVFGQGQTDNECALSELVYEKAEINVIELSKKINALSPQGKTPLAEALESAVKDLNEGTNDKAIILVSDGKETCEGNVAIAAMNAKKAGVKVYTVGFNIDDKGRQELQAIAEETDGQYFDAMNADELIEAFQKISRTLEITKSQNKDASFTFNAESEFTEDAETVKAVVEDCYNSALLIPELVLCREVAFNDFITINNLGTRTADYTITGLPSWIEVQSNVTVEGNGKQTIPFTANPPKNANESEFTMKLNSEEQEITQTKHIIYLPEESCNAIDLIVLNDEIDAEVCEGKKYKLIVENRGMHTQNIKLKSDIAWVYIIQDEFTIIPGERKEVDFYVSPPFDLKEAVTEVTFTAETNRGFKTEATVKVIKTGETYGLEEVNVNLKNNETTLEISDYSKGMLVEFELENDSNRFLVIEKIEVLKYTAEFAMNNTRLNPKETAKAEMIITLDENTTGTTIIPIKFTTNQGTYVRDIKLNAVKEQTPQIIEEPLSIGSGLFSLLGLGGAILGLVLLVLLISAGIIYRQNKNKKEEETETTTEESEETELIQPKTKKKTAKKTKKKTSKRK